MNDIVLRKAKSIVEQYQFWMRDNPETPAFADFLKANPTYQIETLHALMTLRDEIVEN